MRFRKGRTTVVIAIMLLIMTGIIYALTVKGFSYVENFRTGKVVIELRELTDSGRNANMVHANKDVRYVPRIVNKGSECFVRAKVGIDVNGGGDRMLGMDDLYGMSDKWVRRGEWIYCTETLAEDQWADIFEGIHIPASWSEGGGEVDLMVRAEAIQSRNFQPDFSKMLPWGAVILEEAASGNLAAEARPVERITDIEFDKAGIFQCSTSELIDEYKEVMPADIYMKTVAFRNCSTAPLDMKLDVAAGDGQLNEKMQLKILWQDKVFFSGAIEDIKDNGQFYLGALPEGGSGDFRMEISLPADADNRYMEAADDIIWSFSAEKPEHNAVKTGDTFTAWPYLAAVIISILLVIKLLRGRRKE